METILKKLREELNYTQAQVAQMLGVQRPTYSRYENNERQPDNETLKKLADIFDVSVDYLLGRTKERKATESTDITFDDFTYAMHNESKELSEEDKQMLLDMARVLKKRISDKRATTNNLDE